MNNEFNHITFMFVGCDDYLDIGFSNLSNVKEDFETYKEIFFHSDFSIFPQDNIIEIYNQSSQYLRKAIQEYINNRGANRDVLILIFSGHGVAITDDFGLCMNDAVKFYDNSITIPTSVVKISEILSSLFIRDVSLMLIIDACYSGQISKHVTHNVIKIQEIMKNKAVNSAGSNIGLITSCSQDESVRDIGVISKGLKDFCNQGIENNTEEFILFSDLNRYQKFINDIENYTDTSPRIFMPSGRLFDLKLCKNTQYYEIDDFNYYTFTSIYLDVLNVLYKDGNTIELTPKEILFHTKSQSAYGNHKKLSYDSWALVEDSNQGKRKITQRGIDFYINELQIPKRLKVRKGTTEVFPVEESGYIKYKDGKLVDVID